MNLILPAFGLGIVGSLHCIGMCGPIALALPMGQAQKWNSLLPAFYYNVGRILTYSVLGLLFGAFGQLFYLAGLQQILSIVIGALIVLFILIPYRKILPLSVMNGKFLTKIQSGISGLMNKKGNGILFLIGLLNGLLPCGLIYVALAGATATGSFWGGSAFMALFGAGTFPVMFIIPLFKHQIGLSFRSKIKKTYPLIVTIMGILMILRGLDLGIPYISPKLDQKKQTIESCCKKDEINCCKK